jgi:hypothetical protein
VKAPEVRRLAQAHDAAALAAARDAMLEGEPSPLPVDGEDEGEQLTHLMLALRLRAAVDGGAPMKDAFRDLMGSVRQVLTDAD